VAEAALLVALGALIGGAAALRIERREHHPSGPGVLERAARRRLAAALKRAQDLVIASLCLLVLAPLLALIALCIAIDSRGPIFYRAGRVGRGGRRLEMLKFRKMSLESEGGPLTVSDDPRFTRIGRWLARTKLDELPQLFNVLRGEMSLIGPRPEDPFFVHRRPSEFSEILRVRPGITGLSQLAFTAEAKILDPSDPVGDYERRILPQKLALDVLYVNRAGPLLDLRILLWTLTATLLSIPVAVNRSTGKLTTRRTTGGRRRGTRTCHLVITVDEPSSAVLLGLDQTSHEG
jgi:lipopolysaccharide/colanic/teichoic acid biosynthesis glycosyltransferase